MTYQRKTLPQVTILSLEEDSIDEDGDRVAGVVTYLNEFGGKGIILWKDFIELYEEKTDDQTK